MPASVEGWGHRGRPAPLPFSLPHRPVPPACTAAAVQAKKQYDADQKAAEAHRKATLGEWVWSSEAGYYYNAVHRWYYDTNTCGCSWVAGNWGTGLAVLGSPA